jgi:hypothetical protein
MSRSTIDGFSIPIEAIAGEPMMLKKTLRMPLVSDGSPVVTQPQRSERTREIAAESAWPAPTGQPENAADPGVPRPITEDDTTVPVHSSIESSLTFEVLRRQSTDDDEGEKKE